MLLDLPKKSTSLIRMNRYDYVSAFVLFDYFVLNKSEVRHKVDYNFNNLIQNADLFFVLSLFNFTVS